MGRIHHAAVISSRAFVDIIQGVEIGAGTKVQHFACITGNTKIGEDCNIWPHVVLHGPQIGDRCVVASGVVMGPGFKIGNDVFIGPNVVLCNDMWPSTSKKGFDYEALTRGDRFAVIVEDGAAIGAGAIILPGVRIGAGAVVGAGETVSRDVEAGHVHVRRGSDPIKPDRRGNRMRWARMD